jgi:hypothetical protein
VYESPIIIGVHNGSQGAAADQWALGRRQQVFSTESLVLFKSPTGNTNCSQQSVYFPVQPSNGHALFGIGNVILEQPNEQSMNSPEISNI